METLHDKFYLGEWLVEPRLNRVSQGRRTVLIEPKVMQVLACLAAKPGEVIDRERLLEKVWGDTVVTDHVLTRSISELRKVFGDNPRRPLVIETIPKTGYRLVAPVIEADFASDGASARYPGDATPQRAADITIIASMPPPSVAPAPSAPSRKWVALLVGLFSLALVISTWLLAPSVPGPMTPLQTQPLTSYPGIEQHPAFHGKQVAFTWSGPEGGHSNLYVKLIGEDQALPLTDDSTGVSNVAWSPDGRRLAFRRYNRDRCGVFLISALGGPERKLIGCRESSFGLAWSPDGQSLAISTKDTANHTHGLSLLSLETRERRPLTQPEQRYQVDYMVSFSPDGHHLAFVRSNNRSMADIYVFPADGHAPPKRLTFDNRHIAGLTWAADGQSLIFSSNRLGDFKLWRIAAAGGEPEWLAAIGARDPGGVAVAAEEAYLAYEEWEFEINVWGVSLDASEPPPQRFAASTRWDYHPQIAPDGQRIAFASNRTGSFELWTSHFDGSNLMRLTAFGGPFVGMPRWSPDGNMLAFDARVDDRAAIHVIDAEGGLPTRLTGGPADHLAPSWSRDGRWIYFASNRTGAWQIWKKPATGGDAVQVTRDGGYLAFESADGDTLYFSKYGARGLWSVPTDGGPEKLILNALAAYDWGNWTVGEAGIYFVKRTRDGPRLHRFDPSTQAMTPLRLLAGPRLSHEPGLTVSPDGQWILYARSDRVESDIVLVEQFR